MWITFYALWILLDIIGNRKTCINTVETTPQFIVVNRKHRGGKGFQGQFFLYVLEGQGNVAWWLQPQDNKTEMSTPEGWGPGMGQGRGLFGSSFLGLKPQATFPHRFAVKKTCPYLVSIHT